MKNNILTILAIVALFLLSFDKATSLLTNRSKQQIIIHGTNANSVISQTNQMYSQGYRVMSIVGQSVGTTTTGSQGCGSCGETHDISGEIIVIMEK